MPGGGELKPFINEIEYVVNERGDVVSVFNLGMLCAVLNGIILFILSPGFIIFFMVIALVVTLSGDCELFWEAVTEFSPTLTLLILSGLATVWI